MRVKKLIVMAIAFLLVAMLPVVASAATWDVDNWTSFYDVFTNDTDENVIINLLNDIAGHYGAVNTGANQNYTINGGAFKLVEVGIDGAGNVTVNADVVDPGYMGDVTVTQNGDTTGELYAGKNANVTVTGDIDSTSDGVFAEGNAKVNVTGNIKAGSDGVYANDDAQVTVTGNIEAEREGVDANDDAQVTVTGNIKAEGDGVDASDNTQVNVTGNIDADDDGVYANGDAKVTVTGDIKAGDDGVSAGDNTNVTVNGNIDASYGVYTHGDTEDTPTVTVNGDINAEHDGLLVDGESTTTVNGNVTGGSTGIYADENAKVTVNGNVTGTDATIDKEAGVGVVAEDTANVSVSGNVQGGNVPSTAPKPSGMPGPSAQTAGDGVQADNTATVKVGGNVRGGNSATKEIAAGQGLRIWVMALEGGQTPGSITVNGSVIGGANTAGGENANSIYYNVMLLVPEITGATFEEMGRQTQQGLNSLMNTAYMTGVLTQEKLEAILGRDGLGKAMEDDLDAIIGSVPLTDLTAEQLSAIRSVQTQFLQELYTLLFPEGFVYDIPNITVSKLKAVNDAFFGAGAEEGGGAEDLMSANANGVQTNSALNSQALADLLGAEVNYFVNVPKAAGGKVTADKATAKAGETVTFTDAPDKGYALDYITVNGKALTKNADGTYSYVMETGGAEIAVAFKKAGADSTTNGVPKTNDNASGDMWTALVLLSLLGVLVLKKRTVQQNK